MRQKVIDRLNEIRKECGESDWDPLGHEMLDFDPADNLSTHTDEELIQILEMHGVFEG